MAPIQHPKRGYAMDLIYLAGILLFTGLTVLLAFGCGALGGGSR